MATGLAAQRDLINAASEHTRVPARIDFEFDVPRGRGHSTYQPREEEHDRIMSSVEHRIAIEF